MGLRWIERLWNIQTFVNSNFKDKNRISVVLNNNKNDLIVITLGVEIMGAPDEPSTSNQNKMFMEGRSNYMLGEVKSVWCIMRCCNNVIPIMFNASDDNYNIWIDCSKKNTRNKLKEMTNLFFSVRMMNHLLENQQRKSCGYKNEMPHLTCQMILLQITICF